VKDILEEDNSRRPRNLEISLKSTQAIYAHGKPFDSDPNFSNIILGVQ
jgi:hypothetical protein